MTAVDVLVDGQLRLGALAYLVPENLMLSAGDAIEVPFGRRRAHAVVIGSATEPDRATKEVLQCFGRRVDPRELAVAQRLARHHFSPALTLVPRCAPTSAKGAPPLAAGPVRLAGSAAPMQVPHADRAVRFVQRYPLVDPSRLAAELAASMASSGGQVLVLCPTVPLVESVLAEFSSGAARLDAAAARGAWRGFVDGQVSIGVGTRAAALYSAKQLAGIVVVEADHVGHVAQRQPLVHAAEIARERAVEWGVPLAMTGMLPPPTLIGQARVVQTGTPEQMPFVAVFSRAGRDQRRAFPGPVQVEVQRALRAKKRVAVVCDPSSRRRCSSCRQLWDASLGACARCNGVESQVVGWDRERVESFFKGRVRAVSLDELARVRDADVIVLFDVDAPSRRATLSPQRDVASAVLDAAAVAQPGGTLLCVTDGPADAPVFAALAAGDLRQLARVVWQEAREMLLPPFGELVEIRVSGRKTAPDVSQLPGRVAGPRKVADGEWEMLVRCTAAELSALGSVMDVWRSRYRLRVSRR